MKRYSQYLVYLLLLLVGSGCDEGKIYPDETVDYGRTAKISFTINGIKAWPEENILALCAYSDDKLKPLYSQMISKPTREGKTFTLSLTNISPETKTLEIAVVSRGLRTVYSFYSYPVDDSGSPIEADFGEFDLAVFQRIQEQVFNKACLSCHGENGLAGELDLRKDRAYKSLVNVKAPISPEGKNYVTPGDIYNSFLLDILENNQIHSDMFNSTGKQEVLNLIREWIARGAKDN